MKSNAAIRWKGEYWHRKLMSDGVVNHPFRIPLKQMLMLFFTFFIMSCQIESATADRSIERKAMDELFSVLRTRTQFVKVHAGEYLIWLGHPDEPRKEFLKENDLHGNVPKYRVVIWRVLAQAEKDTSKKQEWIKKILAAFTDTAGADRTHAAETIGKLRLHALHEHPEATANAFHSGNRNLEVYTLWANSYSSATGLANNTREIFQLLLSDSDTIVKRISAFILRNVRGLSNTEWETLASKALIEPEESPLRTTLLNTAFVTKPKDFNAPHLEDRIKSEMKKNHRTFSAPQRIELALSLAQDGNLDDFPVLISFLNDENVHGIYESDSDEGADVRAAAAYAILKIKQR